jgi:uncharacterized protein (DUF4213/DUF364 family)
MSPAEADGGGKRIEGSLAMSTAELLDDILGNLPDGVVRRAVVGRRWTAVVVEVKGETRCGLAATWDWDGNPSQAQIASAGVSAAELASTLSDVVGVRASLAAATLNALLPRHPERWTETKAEEVIRQRGANRKVVMVGHFPFADELRPHVGALTVLEEHPRPGDLPASAAPDVLPGADLVVITGMAFVNGSLESLLRLCTPLTQVIVAGPSTPLSPVLLEQGADQLCGAVVEDVEEVLRAVEAGEGFRGVHRAGVRLVSLTARAAI